MCAAGSLRRCRQGAFRGLALTSRHSGARVSPRGTRSSGLRSGATTLHFARADRHLSQRLYGWSGPWATRRGFDSLVQMSAGIAETGMHWRQSNKPVPLPRAGPRIMQLAIFVAAAAIRADTKRLDEG